MKVVRAAFVATLFACVPVLADESAGPLYVPYQSSGIYALGETVGWNVTLPWSATSADYVIRMNNLEEVGRGKIRPGTPTRIEFTPTGTFAFTGSPADDVLMMRYCALLLSAHMP